MPQLSVRIPSNCDRDSEISSIVSLMRSINVVSRVCVFRSRLFRLLCFERNSSLMCVCFSIGRVVNLGVLQMDVCNLSNCSRGSCAVSFLCENYMNSRRMKVGLVVFHEIQFKLVVFGNFFIYSIFACKKL